MANRQALRDLQTRLASRLQAARTQGMSVAWLAVKLGRGNALFPLAQSGEIFPLTNIARVPYAASWFCGVANLRGGLFGVIDLARFMGDSPARGKSEQTLSESSLITFNAELELNCALMVDSLAGLRGQDSFVSSRPPEVGSPVYWGQQYLDAEGGQWQEINLRALSQCPEFLNIGA